MFYVLVLLVSILFWVTVIYFIRDAPVTRKLPQRKPKCVYCHGESLILTYRDHYLKNPKCDKHLNQYEHIMDMENQFFGPPLKVQTIASYDSYWYHSAYASYRVGKSGYVKDGTCYLLESAKITFDRACSFLSRSGYTVNLRFIDETLCYEIIDSLGQFAEIGVLSDFPLGFKLPWWAPKPEPANLVGELNTKIAAIKAAENKNKLDSIEEYEIYNEYTGEAIKKVRVPRARYLKERERA